MLAEMAAAHESSVNFARKDLPLTNPVYEAGSIRWEAPADSDTVYLVYTAYGYNDFQDTDVKVQESLLLPEYKDGCWSCDFHKVTDSIGSLNLGVLDYKVISLEHGEKIGYDISYSGSAMVHLVMPPVYGTKDANGEIGEEGGKIDLDHYVYFDGGPVNILVEEHEGYKLTLLAHKKGTSTSFTLDSTDDPFYWITGEFTKMQKVTLNAGGESEAASVMNRFKHQAPWDPMAEYDGGSLVTFYVPYGMATETFINQYLAPTTVDFLGSTRYIGLGAQPLDAYHSKEEVDAGIANLPKTVTQDMSCCLLWARPIASVDISVNMPAIGTKITSRTAADGTVTQSITPVCTISGDAAFDAGANTSWVDASLQAFNGTVGKDTCYLGSAITPKFGYYFADSSYSAIREGGRTVGSGRVVKILD